MTYQAAFKCEAFIFTEDAEKTAPSWFCQRAKQGLVELGWTIKDGHSKLVGCTIMTGRGRIQAMIGDYIVKYPDGNLYPFGKDTYERLFKPCT